MSGGADYNKYNDITADISKWNTIGEVQKGQKIQIGSDGLGKEEVSISPGTSDSVWQGMARAVTQAFSNTIADAEGTLSWLVGFQTKTKEDIDTVKNTITSDPSVKSNLNSVEVLHTLRKSIEGARKGFENLQETYSNREGVSHGLAQQQAASTKHLAQIDNAIRTAVIKTSTFIENTDEQKKDVTEILQGRGSISTKMEEMTAGDETISMPAEVKKELPRLTLSFNDKQLTSAGVESSHPLEAYRTLSQEFGETTTAVLTLLCTQANIAFTTTKAWESAVESLGIVVDPKGQGMHCFIDVGKENTVVTVNSRIIFKDRENPESPEIKGHGLASRQITIPNATLENLKNVEYAKIKEMEDPLAGASVIDSYTEVLPVEEVAIRAQEKGYMSRQTPQV